MIQPRKIEDNVQIVRLYVLVNPILHSFIYMLLIRIFYAYSADTKVEEEVTGQYTGKTVRSGKSNLTFD